jgi:hypothetical protein
MEGTFDSPCGRTDRSIGKCPVSDIVETSYICLMSYNVRSLNYAESYAAGAAGQPQ